MTGYLDDLNIIYEPIPYSFSEKINDIKTGKKQAILLDFNESKTYFVCGYFTGSHETEMDYCCKSEYTFVKFQSEAEIPEYYGDQKIQVAFQINIPSFALDIVSNEDNAVGIEHFQMYTPCFEEGKNINAKLDFSKCYIYLNDPDKSKVYHSVSAYNYDFVSFPCIRLDEQRYIKIELYIIDSTGDRLDWYIIEEFGKYYDDLVSIMHTEKYSFTDKYGRTHYYGLFEIDDFTNCINK